MTAWLAAVPKIVALLYSLMQMVNAQKDRNLGWSQAVAYGADIAAKQISAAADEMNNAEKIHNSDPSNAAFDPSFERK